MAEIIIEKSANDVWKVAADKLLNEKKLLDGRNGEYREILHTFITIKDPRQKWVYNRVPAISIAYALAEIVWILNGDNAAKIINYWNPALNKFAGDYKYYPGAYGKRIRSHFKFDQLEGAYNALMNNPNSRQVVIQIYDPEVDFPIDKGRPRNDDIPCNVCSLIKVRDGKLEWSQIMRSNDVFLGMPYNFVQFTSIQEILAGWLGLESGTYNHYSDSLHLYQRDVKKIKFGNDNMIHNEDSLAISKKDSDKLFPDMYERMSFLSLHKNITESQLRECVYLDSNYTAYNNIMFVIVAYVAQKCENYKLVSEIMDRCTNKLYCQMWKKWLDK